MEDIKRSSVHINYKKNIKPYHVIIASLVEKYIGSSDVDVLDIGCGTGHLLSEVQKRLPSANLFAADIDGRCLDITMSNVDVKKSMLIDDIMDLFCGDNNHIYDAVIMSHVLEHNLRPADVVKGVMEIIKPGGILILAVPNPVRPTVFLSALSRHNYVNHGHVYAWDRAHWINFLENILRLHVVTYSQDEIHIPFLRRWKAFRKFGEKMALYFPWLAYSNIAVIRKEVE